MDNGNFSYYFQKEKYPIKNPRKETDELKNASKSDILRWKKLIENNFLLSNLSPVWITKNTFGWILVDYNPTKKSTGIIGSGFKKLFDILKGDCHVLVLSRELDRNFKHEEIKDKKILIINIDYFKQFMRIFSNQDKRVALFLYKFENKEDEDIVRGWFLSRPKSLKKRKRVGIDDLDLSTISINDLPKFELAKLKTLHMRLKEFENRLNDFKKLVDKFNNKKDKKHESELTNYIYKNPWLLDLRYLGIKFKVEKEVPLKLIEGKGKNKYESKIDVLISTSKNSLNEEIVIELKRPDVRTTKPYRKEKEAITCHVANGLSQLINYLVEKNSENSIKHGVLIVGSKRDKFIDIFEQYLHNIKILTYMDIYDQTKERIEAFKGNDLNDRQKIE